MEALTIPAVAIVLMIVSPWIVIIWQSIKIKNIFKSHQTAILILKSEHHEELQLVRSRYNTNLKSIKNGAYLFEKVVKERLTEFELKIKRLTP